MSMNNKPKLPQLKMKNGAVIMIDDSDPTEYLKERMANTEIVILPFEAYQELKYLAAMAGIG